jgi:hypothetical protein
MIAISPASGPITTPPVSPVAPALSISTSALPSASVGSTYDQILQAVGGTAPYVWSITSGQLPAGLVLSANGAISGLPNSAGSFTFTTSVSDSSSPVQTQSAGLTIVATAAAASPLTIASPSLASGTTGSPYVQALRASGGTPGLPGLSRERRLQAESPTLP